MAIYFPFGAVGFARRGLLIGMALVALIMSLNVVHTTPLMSSPVPARAAGPASSPASDPVVNPGMPRLRADMKGVAASADVQLVADWMMRNNKHRGHPFIVADKVNGLLFAFAADGALLAKTLALFGAARSDVMTDEQANKPLEGMRPSDMITPAGLFVAEAYLSPTHGKSVRFAEYAETNLLIHRAPSAKRLKRLQSPSASDTRTTLGCINLLPEFMDNVLMPNFSGESTVVVLPETQSAKSFFAINDATEPVPKTENVAADKPFTGSFLRLSGGYTPRPEWGRRTLARTFRKPDDHSSQPYRYLVLTWIGPAHQVSKYRLPGDRQRHRVSMRRASARQPGAI